MTRSAGWMLLMALGFGLPLGAAEAPAERTFDDFLRRVVARDEPSGMILSVRPRPDAPGRVPFLGVEMRRVGDDRAVELITLVYSKAGDTLFERYLLKPSPAIEAELQKVKRGRALWRQKALTRIKNGGRAAVDFTLRDTPTSDEPVRPLSAGRPLPRILGEEDRDVGRFTASIPSPAFADVLSRVTDREATTGAIYGVKSRPDAPQAGVRLNFSLEVQGTDAVVTLTRPLKTGTDVYEQYRLKVTPEIQAEADRLRRHSESEKGSGEARKQEIVRLSGGKLRYGLKVEEVERIMGPGRRGEPHQALGSFTLSYPTLILHFANSHLTWVEKAGEGEKH